MSKFSVLLSIYIKEDPKFFKQALDSVFNQTMPPNEVILVEDGPLTKELYSVIEEFQEKHADILRTVIIEKNSGLGNALNKGLYECKYDLVARMDTDDIAKPYRFEKQVKVFDNHPEIDVCSSWMDEFEVDINNVVSTKTLPESHEALYKYGKYRNPINHPAVMFRKSAVMSVGNYKDFYLFEDYYLWIRMLLNNCIFYNIQESLMFFRKSPSMMQRRKGWKYIKSELRLQKRIKELGYIDFWTMLENMAIRFSARILPNILFRKFYYVFLRNKKI